MRILALLLPLILVACETQSDTTQVTTDEQRVADPGSNEEVDVPLNKVPANVMAAAQKAVPGFTATKVEREVEDGVVVYDVAGTAKGMSYEVEVTADGKVLEIEEEDDGDEHEDDDDDEDHDEDDD